MGLTYVIVKSTLTNSPSPHLFFPHPVSALKPMFDILSLLQCLLFHLDETLLGQLSIVITAMLAMSGRVTMLGISRWAGKGGSYRTVQRLFSTPLPWPRLFWEFFRYHCWCPDQTYLLAGDEVVVTKSGKQTHGLGRFFSSLYDHPVKGLGFFELSLVSVEQSQSFPLRTEQVIHQEVKTKAKAKATRNAKGKSGRPPGSKNRDKTQVHLTSELLQVKGMITACLSFDWRVIPPQLSAAGWTQGATIIRCKWHGKLDFI